ncbi:MAG TPA: serine/threonine-protein kinase [Kofleriaceae bacterium]|nr:serine/threonine-protein kinase [Kofleriaceae bacterium]
MTASSSLAGAVEGSSERKPAIDAIDIADYLLELIVRQAATCVWLEPKPDGVHTVAIEQRGGTLGGFALGDGMGDAVLARLALLCEIDLLSGGSGAGTARVRQGERTSEVVVTTRVTDSGLAGELRTLEERVTQVAGTAAVLDGRLSEEFTPGTRIGTYQIARQIGRGGMGIVYEVEHTVLGKRFAMKVLASSVLARDSSSSRRFVREARAAARVRHPGIVDVTDFGTLRDGRPYLVMELLSGQALHELAAEAGALTALEPLRAARIMHQVCHALGAAHSCGVVHRDLTPANIFVLPDGDSERVVLVDFGSASTPEHDAEVNDGPPGVVIGTPHYISPEQLRGRPGDARSDIYAVGIILFELLSGNPPFDGASARDIALQHLQAEIPPIESPHGELPEELVRIVHRCMAKQPEDRFASATELIAALDRIENMMNRRGWRRWLPR